MVDRTRLHKDKVILRIYLGREVLKEFELVCEGMGVKCAGMIRLLVKEFMEGEMEEKVMMSSRIRGMNKELRESDEMREYLEDVE